MSCSCRLGQILERHIERNVVIVGQGKQFFQFVGVGRRVPGRDRPFAQRFAGSGTTKSMSMSITLPKPFALRTRAQRAVETVEPRLGRRIVAAAVVADHLVAEGESLPGSAVERVRRAAAIAVQLQRLGGIDEHDRLTIALAKAPSSDSRMRLAGVPAVNRSTTTKDRSAFGASD